MRAMVCEENGLGRVVNIYKNNNLDVKYRCLHAMYDLSKKHHMGCRSWPGRHILHTYIRINIQIIFGLIHLRVVYSLDFKFIKTFHPKKKKIYKDFDL